MSARARTDVRPASPLAIADFLYQTMQWKLSGNLAGGYGEKDVTFSSN
jgi:hypothetical protein